MEYDIKENKTTPATETRKMLEMGKFESYNVTSRYTM
jgi:hypothetical protein